ncbi:helix-turn-helix domain-containing protein [Thalassospiraceae bacterium LMO-JJ14]|nr:helix-turn-helix domain-containing protein [Thalassospiraceae bacterium LMO-JJ14]
MSGSPQKSPALKPAIPRGEAAETPCAACQVREHAVCGALAPAELSRFGGVMKNVILQPGDHLVDEGEPETHVFSVTNGCLKCFKLLPDGRRQIIGFLFPGDFLGLARSETNPSSVEAVTQANVCRMERRELEKLAGSIPNLERRLHDMASEALAEVQGQLLLLGRKTAHERVATFLLMLARRAGERGVSANPVDVPMSRDDIGDFLGLTTETVSRTFSRLRKDGLIGGDRDRKIEILDEDGLTSVAEGF